MARSDWAALLTEPAAEYLAHTELLRFGLDVYLPQLRKRHHTRAGKYIMRHYPLFPRYILIRVGDAHDPAIRITRGVTRFRPVLADENGRPWRAPQFVIEGIREAERRCEFDEILHKGDHVTLAFGVMATVRSVLTSSPATNVVELLTPLFGGTRATAKTAMIAAHV